MINYKKQMNIHKQHSHATTKLTVLEKWVLSQSIKEYLLPIIVVIFMRKVLNFADKHIYLEKKMYTGMQIEKNT